MRPQTWSWRLWSGGLTENVGLFWWFMILFPSFPSTTFEWGSAFSGCCTNWKKKLSHADVLMRCSKGTCGLRTYARKISDRALSIEASFWTTTSHANKQTRTNFFSINVAWNVDFFPFMNPHFFTAKFCLACHLCVSYWRIEFHFPKSIIQALHTYVSNAFILPVCDKFWSFVLI